MFDFLAKFLGRGSSGATAKERLRLVLLSDHLSLAPDVVEALKHDLIEVISRYVEVDIANCDVTFEQREKEVAMLANIPILGMHKRPTPTPPSPPAPPPPPSERAPEPPAAGPLEPASAMAVATAPGAPPAVVASRPLPATTGYAAAASESRTSPEPDVVLATRPAEPAAAAPVEPVEPTELTPASSAATPSASRSSANGSGKANRRRRRKAPGGIANGAAKAG